MIDLFGLVVVCAILLLIVAVVTNRIDWFHALIAVVALVVLWYLLAGAPDLTLHRGP